MALKNKLNITSFAEPAREDYLLVMERSPVRDTEIKTLLKEALTEKTDDREVYMKGLDYSCGYEGYSAYKAEEL